MRRRRSRVSSTDPRRPQGHLRATNRQDSTGAAVMVGPSISRIKKNIFFHPSVSVPLISLDHERTERYSNNCMPRFLNLQKQVLPQCMQTPFTATKASQTAALIE